VLLELQSSFQTSFFVLRTKKSIVEWQHKSLAANHAEEHRRHLLWHPFSMLFPLLAAS